MSRLSFLSVLTLSLFAGCTGNTLPPLTTNNPASADAREAVTPPARSVLGIDQATRRTSQLIAARAEQESQRQSEQRPEQDMQNMPGVKHDQEGAHENR
jgi:hypothetical protein